MALTHSERALLTDRSERYSVIQEIYIGGEDYTSRLINASVTWTAEGAGGSNMEFGVEGSLEHLSDAPVTYRIGYGRDDVKTYFKGRLQIPKDHETLPQATGIAFGPFRLLTDTFLTNTQTYQGRSLEYVLMDLSRRAEYPTGDFIVLGGRNFKVPAGELYSMGTSLQEIASSVMEKAKFVGFDSPGGRRIVMPTPQPGSNGSIKAVYSPDAYKSFSIEPSHEVAYHSVVVYRSEGSTFGGNAVYAEQKVDPLVRFKPAKSRVMYVGDFPGTQSQAADEAFRLAQVLRDGEQNFSMTIPFNRELTLYDGFRAIRIKNIGNGIRQREVYICTIKELSASIQPGTTEMSVSGTCYQVRNEQFDIEQIYEPRATSYGIVVPSVEFTTPDDSFIPTEDYTFVG